MLYAKSLKYGIFPYGVISGCNSFLLEFENNEEKFIETEKEQQEYVQKMLADLLNPIKEMDKVDEWSRAIQGEVPLTLKCDHLSDQVLEIIQTFLKALSYLSLQIQGITPEMLEMEDKSALAKLMEKSKPPFIGLISNPEYFSGRKRFYEFNTHFTIMNCPVNRENKILSDLALVELGGHTAGGIFVFEVEKAEDFGYINSGYIDKKVLDVIPNRIFIKVDPNYIGMDETEKIREETLKRGYRYTEVLEGKWILPV